MPRIRTIKPEMWESEKTGTLSPLGRLLFIGLISLADDDGLGRSEVRLLRSKLFPYDHHNTTKRLPTALKELQKRKLVVFYKCPEGCEYYWIPGFKDNQRIDKYYPSPLPKPDGFFPYSKNDSRKVSSGMEVEKEKEKEVEGEHDSPCESPEIGTVYSRLVQQWNSLGNVEPIGVEKGARWIRVAESRGATLQEIESLFWDESKCKGKAMFNLLREIWPDGNNSSLHDEMLKTFCEEPDE